MVTPFFSIIVPTYNRGLLIGETIESILQQDNPNFELLIVDDGSTDNTEQVVKSYKDERIRYFKKQNEERGAARNYGIKKATGRYALFFDSDDWMHANHLSTLKEYIDKAPDKYTFLATKYQLKEPDGEVLPGATVAMKEGWYQFSNLLKGNMFGCLVCFKLQDEKLVFHEEDRGYATLEDWMFLLANLQHTDIYLIDRVTISVRHHDERSMANNTKVIAARKKATDWAVQHLRLSASQERTLKAYSHYFCAIHFYLDGQRPTAWQEIKASLSNGGPKKELAILFLKTLVGKAWIEKRKRT